MDDDIVRHQDRQGPRPGHIDLVCRDDQIAQHPELRHAVHHGRFKGRPIKSVYILVVPDDFEGRGIDRHLTAALGDMGILRCDRFKKSQTGNRRRAVRALHQIGHAVAS